ncbi:ribonuclease HII [Candidatus Parcubacteria bacterium]|nr:MAG: ribonuclease HII [Candidatus Parcubacteria bacterium]
MKDPTLRYERNLWNRGFRFVAGLDEVGVGCLAGPVVVGCVVCKKGFRIGKFSGLRDSKALTPIAREKFAKMLKSSPDIAWAVAKVYPKVIDRVNIFQATRLAMVRLAKKIDPNPDFLLIDGAAILRSVGIPQKAVVKGDKKIFSVAAASVLAKVTRDKIMKRWALRLPGYGFEKHKGYGTKLHYKALKRLGASDIHRNSFLKNV